MSLDRVSAWGGSFWIGDTVTQTLNGKGEPLKVKSIICQEDTVITILEGKDANNNSVNFRTLFNLNDTSPGPTLKQGCLLCVPLGWAITTIKLASGSIIAYE